MIATLINIHFNIVLLPAPKPPNILLPLGFQANILYVFIISPTLVKSRDVSIGIPTGYGLDGRGSIPSRGKRFFSAPQRPDRL
jgi:hypothetical protein